jgi:hypothetical protein
MIYVAQDHPKVRNAITTEFGTKDLILDLGVGNRKQYHDAIGLDVRDYPAVDMIADATVLIPLPDNSVKLCYSYHTIEHITTLNYSPLFREIYRVCQPGSVIDWWFPYWTHRTAYDFSHVTYLNEYCFQGAGFQGWFEIDRVDYNFEDYWKTKSPEEREFARIHYMNAVKEMRLIFHPRKDATGKHIPM